MKPWKSTASPRVSQAAPPLQWGHGDEAVEESVDFYGNVVFNPLQWGHGDEAVEELPNITIDVRMSQASMGPRR